jgi:hypothetical protein
MGGPFWNGLPAADFFRVFAGALIKKFRGVVGIPFFQLRHGPNGGAICLEAMKADKLGDLGHLVRLHGL